MLRIVTAESRGLSQARSLGNCGGQSGTVTDFPPKTSVFPLSTIPPRIPVLARFSAPVQTGPGAHPASCTMGTGSFPGVKSGRGVTLTPHPLLVPLVMKEWSYTSNPPMGRTACREPQCLYKGDLYLYSILLRTTIKSARCKEITIIGFPTQSFNTECYTPSLMYF